LRLDALQARENLAVSQLPSAGAPALAYVAAFNQGLRTISRATVRGVSVVRLLVLISAPFCVACLKRNFTQNRSPFALRRE